MTVAVDCYSPCSDQIAFPVPHEFNSALLYKAHRTALIDYANGIVRDRARAEDVVQDAWERFQAVEGRRTLVEPLRYFYRIVRNLALDGYRVQKRDRLRQDGEVEAFSDSLADEAPSPEAEASAREELRLVLKSLDELPERTRLAVRLYKFEGLKLREVAETMGISVALANALVLDGVEHCAQRLMRGR